MWVYSRLGYQKKGKGTPSLSYGYFYKYHFHETNLVDENWIVENKIIHVAAMIFHVHT